MRQRRSEAAKEEVLEERGKLKCRKGERKRWDSVLATNHNN